MITPKPERIDLRKVRTKVLLRDCLCDTVKLQLDVLLKVKAIFSSSPNFEIITKKEHVAIKN